MSKRGPKYDSQRDRENYTFHPGRQFHLEFNPEPGACYLMALDERQLVLLRRMLAVFPKYYWVWGLPGPMSEWDAGIQQQWTDISDFVEELEACLLSGCDVSELLTQMTRIADTLEDLVAAEAGEVHTLDEILLEMQNADISDIADIVEVLNFVKELVPNFSINLGLAGLIRLISEWRFRQGVTNLLTDIAISQRAQAVAQGGVEYNTIFSLIDWIETATAADGGPLGWVTGAAVWLWTKLRPAQLNGWTTWIGVITGALLGSIRGATYDVAGAIDDTNTALANIEAKLEAANLQDDDIEEILDSINEILGGTSVIPPP